MTIIFQSVVLNILQLKQLQSKHNEVLAAEWKRREKARELDFRSKMSEVDALAADLKKGIAAVDARERELTKKEKELAQEKQKLEKIKDRLDFAPFVLAFVFIADVGCCI